MGGFLAEPRSEFENDNVMSLVEDHVSYWIGKIISQTNYLSFQKLEKAFIIRYYILDYVDFLF